jgi:hypothetical protein
MKTMSYGRFEIALKKKFINEIDHKSSSKTSYFFDLVVMSCRLYRLGW